MISNRQSIYYTTLGSGSSANSYIIEGAQASVVIDQGFSLHEFLDRARRAQFVIEKIEYIFLTHDHSDHIKGAVDLANYLDVPIIMHHKTKLKAAVICRRWNIEANRFYCDDHLELSFNSFSTSHDAANSLGYAIEFNSLRFTIITDTGCTNQTMLQFANCSDVLFLESNYSATLLASGSYPPFLKNRIASSRGHLSNHHAAAFIKQIESDRLKKIYLCHLSKNNNSEKQLLAEYAEQGIDLAAQEKRPIIICPHNQMMPRDSIKNQSMFANHGKPYFIEETALMPQN